MIGLCFEAQGADSGGMGEGDWVRWGAVGVETGGGGVDVQGTVKFGGGNIMVWGCMGWNGVEELAEVEDGC